jgi:hypothetical protein
VTPGIESLRNWAFLLCPEVAVECIETGLVPGKRRMVGLGVTCQCLVKQLLFRLSRGKSTVVMAKEPQVPSWFCCAEAV